MKKAKSVIYLCILCCIFGISTPIFAADIFHTKPSQILSKEPIELLVELGVDLEDAEVSIFYRLASEPNFSEENLDSIGGSAYRGILSPVISDEKQFLYYIQVRSKKGDIHTLPEFNPSESPFVVSIEQDITEKPSVKILNPQNDSIVSDDFPTFLLGFEDEFNQLNYKTFTFSIDEKNLTRKVFLSPPFATYIPQRKLKTGPHTVKISILDKQGEKYSDSIVYKFQKVKPKLFTVSGSVNWQQAVFNSDKVSTVSSREPYESKLKTILNIDTKYFKSKINISRDNRDTPQKQPLNRFKYQINDRKKHANIILGDATPKFSVFSYNAKKVTGFEVNLDTLRWLGFKKFLTLKLASGATKKAIPIQTNVTQGTFKQEMTGVQLGLNFGKLKHSLNYIKIQDQLNSLVESKRGTTLPKENHVISLATDYQFFDQTRLQVEIAADANYSDTTAPAISIDELDIGISKSMLKKITKTLPLRSSLTGGYAANIKFVTPVIGRKLIFRGSTQWIHPSFTSLGNSGLKKDNFDYNLGLNSRLFNNNLTLSGSLRSQRNNVNEKEDATTFSDTYRLSSSYTLANVGVFNTGYSLTSRKNKLKPKASSTTRIKNKLNTLSLGVSNIKIITGDINNQLNTNLSLSTFNDVITKTNNFDSKVIGFNTSTDLDNIKLKFGLNRSIKDAKSVTPNTTTFTTLSSKLTYKYIPKVLTVYTGLKLTSGINNGKELSQQIDTKKIVFSVGGSLNIKSLWQFQKSKLRFNLDFSESKDNKDKSNRAVNFSDTYLSLNFSSKF